MMSFTERGFMLIKTIENKQQSSSMISRGSGSSMGNDKLELDSRYDQVEKAFENVFLTRKGEWEVKIEKFLPANPQDIMKLLPASIQNAEQTCKIESLKVIQENSDPNIVIEIAYKCKSIKENPQEDAPEKYTYLRTNRSLVSVLEKMGSINISPHSKEPLIVKGYTYEFGDYFIRIGKQDKLKKLKLQIEYTPSIYDMSISDIGQDKKVEMYSNKVIKPVVLHIFQNFEQFKETRASISEIELDPVTQEPKIEGLLKELQEIPSEFRSTHLMIKAYFDETFPVQKKPPQSASQSNNFNYNGKS